MIDVLLPSRGRPTVLAASIRALRSLAAQPESVRVQVAADDDDDATHAAASEAGAHCHVFPRHGYGGLHLYYQGLAARCDGDWLLVWNDDATMRTPGWDEIITGLPPAVLVADIQSPHSPLCCFPAVRREAVSMLGRFSTDNPHVDTFWQDLGAATGTIAVVPVEADAMSPVRPDQTHGFYEAPHQAEMAACAQTLRDALHG